MGKKQNEKTSKIKNAIVVLIIMTIISIFFSIVVVSDNSPEKIQYLNSLDYSVNLNSDGSMQVTEIWDINVKNTNTLFKTFKLNSSKYGDAVYETSANGNTSNGSWYGDYSNFPDTSTPFFLRGGTYVNGTIAGVFYFGNNYGDSYSDNSFRPVLVAL